MATEPVRICPECGNRSPVGAERCSACQAILTEVPVTHLEARVAEAPGTGGQGVDAAAQGVETGGETEIVFRALREVAFKTESWQIALTSSAMEFTLQGPPGKDEKTHISIPRSAATTRLKTEGGFGRNFRKLNGKRSGIILYIKPLTPDAALVGVGVQYEDKFLISREDWSRIRSWLAETPAEERREAEKEARSRLAAELRGRGVVYLLLGGAHFVFSNSLEPTWGVVLVLIGLLNLAVVDRSLFIINGVALVLAGAWNALIGELGGSFGWRMLGIGQVVWGLQEFSRYGHYGTLSVPGRPGGDRPLRTREIERLRGAMEQKSTEKLLEMWNSENPAQFLPETLEAVRLVLLARGIDVSDEGGARSQITNG